MRRELDAAWLDVVRFFGVSAPADVSEQGLIDWAKPHSSPHHPARRNRRMLYDLYQAARTGDVSHFRQVTHEPASGSTSSPIPLGHTVQFERLEALVQMRGGQRDATGPTMAWVRSYNARLADELKQRQDAIEALAPHVESFLEHDMVLHNKAAEVLVRFEEEGQGLERLRQALDHETTPNRGERLGYLDAYTEQVLAPMAETVLVIENTRTAMIEHFQGMVADAVLASAGVPVAVMALPSFDDLAQLIDAVPSLGDPSTFQTYQNQGTYKSLQSAVDKAVLEAEKAFGAKVEIDRSALVEQVTQGSTHIQVNVLQGSGTLQAAMSNTTMNR